MKPLRVIAGLAIAGGVAVGAIGATGVGVASADWPPPPPGPDHHDWGPPPPPPPWGDPPPPPWAPPPPPPPWEPPPPPPPPPDGTWNGGWEPDGGFCLFSACV